MSEEILITDNTEAKESDKKSYISKITEVIGLLSATVAVLSIFSSILLKYISFGRCLYFDFDLDYYDFSLSNSSTFVFYLSVIAGVISCITSLLLYTLWKKIVLNIHKRTIKVIIVIIIGVLYFIAIAFLSVLFLPEKYTAATFCALIIIFTILIYGLIYSMQLELKSKKRFLYMLVAFILILVIIAPICMKTQYDAAKNQRDFPIITEKNVDGIKHYAVISKGKDKYSAFFCELREEDGKNVLYIMTDNHKFFNINETDTTIVRFHEIRRTETIPLSVNEFIK